MSGLLEGIDISHHNWSVIKTYGAAWLRRMAADGFVIMKASEGCTFTDPKCAVYTNMINRDPWKDYPCVGYYHYARPEYNTARDEARHFMDVVHSMGIKNTGALLALDVEGRALSVPDVGTWSREWLDAVYMEMGVKPLVYCQRSALPLFKEVVDGDYGLWLAAWTARRPKNVQPWPFMAIWQYSSLGLDKDYFFGGKEQFRRYAGIE